MEKGHVSSKGHIKNPSKNWSAKGAKVRSAHHPGSENWATSGVSCPWEVFGHEVGCCSNMAEYHGVRGREGVTRKALEAAKLWILGSCEVEKSSPPVPIQIWSSSPWWIGLDSSLGIVTQNSSFPNNKPGFQVPWTQFCELKLRLWSSHHYIIPINTHIDRLHAQFPSGYRTKLRHWRTRLKLPSLRVWNLKLPALCIKIYIYIYIKILLGLPHLEHITTDYENVDASAHSGSW